MHSIDLCLQKLSCMTFSLTLTRIRNSQKVCLAGFPRVIRQNEIQMLKRKYVPCLPAVKFFYQKFIIRGQFLHFKDIFLPQVSSCYSSFIYFIYKINKHSYMYDVFLPRLPECLLTFTISLQQSTNAFPFSIPSVLSSFVSFCKSFFFDKECF